MSRQYYFTGGYTEPIQMASGEIVQGRCKGIGCYKLEPENGRLEQVAVTASTENPSYVLADPRGPYLYCVNEMKSYEGVPGSTVTAYEILPESGKLRFLNRQFTCGADACHLTLTGDGRFLLAANYSGGSFCVFPVRADHGLEPCSCVLRHQGRGVNPERQESPHPHQTLMSPDRQYVYVSDLGLDRLVCYRGDWEKGWLLPENGRDILGLPGQGVRHGVFNQTGDRLYVMTEMGCEINVYVWESEGRYKLLQTVSAREEGRREPDLGAAIRLHPSGKWLYGSVRGSNELAAFAVKADGCLERIQRLSCGGEIPRDFVLSPDGRWLLAGCQDTDSITVFSIDGDSGTLTLVYTKREVPCVTTVSVWEG